MAELERDAERLLRDEVKKLGGKSYKFVSPGNSGVPDRIVLLLDRLQELMGRAPVWGRDIPLGSAGFQNPFYMKD